MLNQNITFEFRIKYKTNHGQEIYIFGDNDDFGYWKTPKFKLTWTERHIWKKEYKININIKLIKYKFVVVTNNDPNQVLWEKGQIEYEVQKI